MLLTVLNKLSYILFIHYVDMKRNIICVYNKKKEIVTVHFMALL